MKTLSAYTHARHCCDTADITAGIDEINKAINRRMKESKPVPYFYGVRLTKLKNKLNKLTDKEIKK
jgi:hypothetical protein